MKNKEILFTESYLKMIENSVGSRIFNSLYVKDIKGNAKDVLNDGEYSCAIFVSSILLLFGLLDKLRATVNNLDGDLGESSKFTEVKEKDLQPGDIIFWEKFEFDDGSINRHVGFYLDNLEAISTSYRKKQVDKHHYKNFSGEIERKIEKIYRITIN